MNTKEVALHYAEKLGKILNVSVSAGDDDILLELDGWVYVSSATITVEHPRVFAPSAETLDVPGFIVQKAVRIPGSHWEPDDVDVVDDGEYRVLTDAIAAAFLLVQENTINNVIQSTGEALWFSREGEEQV